MEKQCEKLCDPSLKIWYIGVDNPNAIKIGDIPFENIQAEIDYGSVKKYKQNFCVQVYASQPSVNICYYYTNPKGITIRSFDIAYEVRRIPDPRAVFGSIVGDRAPRSLILQQHELIVIFPACFLNVRAEVVSFEINIEVNGEYRTFIGRASGISDEMRRHMERCPLGSKISFENIIARSPDSCNRKLGSITITII